MGPLSFILLWSWSKANPYDGKTRWGRQVSRRFKWRAENRKAQPQGLGQEMHEQMLCLPDFRDLVGLRSLLPLDDLELYRVAFLQGLKSFTLDGRVMDEDISSAVLADKAITLAVVEPLYFTLKSCHLRPP